MIRPRERPLLGGACARQLPRRRVLRRRRQHNAVLTKRGEHVRVDDGDLDRAGEDARDGRFDLRVILTRRMLTAKREEHTVGIVLAVESKVVGRVGPAGRRDHDGAAVTRELAKKSGESLVVHVAGRSGALEWGEGKWITILHVKARAHRAPRPRAVRRRALVRRHARPSVLARAQGPDAGRQVRKPPKTPMRGQRSPPTCLARSRRRAVRARPCERRLRRSLCESAARLWM